MPTHARLAVTGSALLIATALAGGRARAQSLDALEKEVIKLFDRARTACVSVEVQERTLEGAPGRKRVPRFTSRSQLSGTVWDASGTIVTLGADLANADWVKVTFQDGSQYRATIVAEDSESSLGVLKIEGAPVPATAVQWGDSSKLTYGSLVVAVGSPFGMRATPSIGFVTGLDRQLAEESDERTKTKTPGMIQIQTPVNPGDTGGPLVNSSGEVVGLLSSVFRRANFDPSLFAAPPAASKIPPTPSSPAPPIARAFVIQNSLSAEGIGFAMPAKQVRPIVEKLLEKPNAPSRSGPSSPWLGITVEPIGAILAAQLGLDEDSVLVSGVARNGPAARAGIQKYDVLLMLDGKEIPTQESLIEVLSALAPGAEVKASVRRQEKQMEVNIKLDR
jgi:serine protease Do